MRTLRNPAAEALLHENDGLSSIGLRLVATTRTYTDRLAKAISQAAGTVTLNDARTGRTLRAPRRSTDSSMTITVMPLPADDGRVPGVQLARALVIVHRHERSIEVAAERLREAYWS